jgi:hypothetical protein
MAVSFREEKLGLRKRASPDADATASGAPGVRAQPAAKD